jgi:hypothetical protein
MLHQPDPRQLMPSAEAADKRVVIVRKVYMVVDCKVFQGSQESIKMKVYEDVFDRSDGGIW